MLTSEQAQKNQEQYGYNELTEGKKKTVLQIFAEQFKDFLVIILIISAVVSGFLGDYESTIVILAVITMNAILGTVQTTKAEKSLASLKKLTAPEAKVIRDGVMIVIPSREVTIGDEVIIEAGDSIPADGKLLSCASLKVDESALTGESLSVEKSMDEVTSDVPIGDRTNEVFAGCFATYGRASFEVSAIGMKTEVGKIATLLSAAADKKTPLQKSLDEFGRKLSILILIFCGILFGVSIFRGQPIADAFLFAVALAVAAIPEALSSIVTIVLSFGTQAMAKEKAVIRKLQAVEGLGSVSVICSDKTGTLTQNKMTVEDYYVNEKSISFEYMLKCDHGMEELGKEFWYGECERALAISAILCNDANVIENQEIGDPTETALVNLGNRLGYPVEEIRGVYYRKSEVPFDSDRKLMSTAHEIDGRYLMITKGAVDVLLNRCTKIRVGNVTRDITEEDKRKIEEQNMMFSRNGLRVLAFTYKEDDDSEKVLSLEDENNLTFLGLIDMMDPPREESAAAVKECIDAGIKPVMITGDHKITAAAIARRIGILKEDSEACEGAVIEEMSDEELKEFVPKISVYARVSPEHKIRIVRAWQERGNIVAMTGDGVNDAPALKQADIGVAMGITGSEVSKDAAAMVLGDDNFATIVKAVEYGRNIYQNIKHAIQFLLSGNFAGILVVLAASVANLPVPFAAVHLLFINLLTDSLPAIALGLEPHNREVMKEKPRPINEPVLTKNFLCNIGIDGLVIGIMTMTAFIIGLNSGSNMAASTMAFATLCCSRLVHGFNCKSDRAVFLSKRFFNNKYQFGAFFLGLFLLCVVLFVPGLETIFKVAPLTGMEYLTVFGLSVLNFPVIQLLKWIKSKMN